MKVQKIKSINIGSFNNFHWDTSLTDFNNKINVLLGWNGAGDLLSKIEQAYNSYTDIFMERMAKADDTAKEAKRREITGKREMLYRYINYGSHEFLGIDKIDMSALQHSNDVINDFFELIEKIDKEHYKTFKLN